MLKIAIGTPWSSPFMYTGFVDSAMNLKVPEGCTTRFFRGRGFCPARAHIHICEQAAKWHAQLIIIIGPDQVHPENMIEKLVAHYLAGKHLVAAMVPFRGYLPHQGMTAPFQPMAWKTVDGKNIPIDPKDGDLQAADLIGTGVVMFPTAGLVNVQKPWFSEQIIEPQTFSRIPNQDSRFIQRYAKGNGLQLWVDTTIKVGHLHVFEIDESFQHRFSDLMTDGGKESDIVRKEGVAAIQGRQASASGGASAHPPAVHNNDDESSVASDERDQARNIPAAAPVPVSS
jgi:hypothetical protein